MQIVLGDLLPNQARLRKAWACEKAETSNIELPQVLGVECRKFALIETGVALVNAGKVKKFDDLIMSKPTDL